MSSPTPNIPALQGTDFVPDEPYVYDHIPRLQELLPQLRGVPGYYYLQVAVENQKRAELEGWREVANSVTYTISGPAGRVDVKLFCFGARIPGADYQGSKRECYHDYTIADRTGLANISGWEAPAGEIEPDTVAVSAVEPPVGEEVELTETKSTPADSTFGGVRGSDAEEPE